MTMTSWLGLRRLWPISAALSIAMCAGTAFAEAAPDRWRSGSYYAIHGSIAAALVGARVWTSIGREGLEAGGDTIWFPGDAGLRGSCSPEAANLSDVSLSLGMAFPVGAELGTGMDARFANAELVYTQALLANQLLTSLAKVVFRRPRPFSYRKDRDCIFVSDPEDANLSFFSGHASSAFAAAFAGGYLLAEKGLDTRTRSAVWSVELALAGATANLRARAGKHYYSDILVGALVGTTFGIGIPVLHGGELVPTGADLLAGSVGLVVGVAASQLIAVGAEAIDERGARGTLVSPLPVPYGYGVQVTQAW